MADEIPTYTCTNAICGYKTTIPCAWCRDCGHATSTNRNPNSTPTPASEEAVRTHIGEMTAAAAIPPHANAFFSRTFEPQRPEPRQDFLQRHQEDEMKRATATAASSSSSSSSSSAAPLTNASYTRARAFETQPQPRQNPTSRAILDPLLQRHVQEHEEEKKAAARIAEYDERNERARGFDEEDDEEFIPNVGKEKQSEKKDKGKGKERG